MIANDFDLQRKLLIAWEAEYIYYDFERTLLLGNYYYFFFGNVNTLLYQLPIKITYQLGNLSDVYGICMIH